MNNCCVECFDDQFLKDHINQKGEIGDCNFCHSSNVMILEATELVDLFDPIVNLYSIVENFVPTAILAEGFDGQMIWEKIQEDWQIFSSWDYDFLEDLMGGIYADRDDPREGGLQLLHSFVESEDDWYGLTHEHNRKLEKEWNSFCEELKFKNRFFIHDTLDLEGIIQCLEFLDVEIKQGEILYRARNSYLGDRFKAKEMGPPPLGVASSGRANPRGIPYLYLASNINTAISEIRPSSGDNITVGRFKCTEDISLIDLRFPISKSPFEIGDSLELFVKTYKFLNSLGQVLSRPVHRSQSEIDYLPSQFISELIKNQQYEGLIYKSSLGSGHNIAMFDKNKVKCTSTSIYYVDKVEYQYAKQ